MIHKIRRTKVKLEKRTRKINSFTYDAELYVHYAEITVEHNFYWNPLANLLHDYIVAYALYLYSGEHFNENYSGFLKLIKGAGKNGKNHKDF